MYFDNLCTLANGNHRIVFNRCSATMGQIHQNALSQCPVGGHLSTGADYWTRAAGKGMLQMEHKDLRMKVAHTLPCRCMWSSYVDLRLESSLDGDARQCRAVPGEAKGGLNPIRVHPIQVLVTDQELDGRI